MQFDNLTKLYFHLYLEFAVTTAEFNNKKYVSRVTSDVNSKRAKRPFAMFIIHYVLHTESLCKVSAYNNLTSKCSVKIASIRKNYRCGLCLSIQHVCRHIKVHQDPNPSY